MPSLSAEEKRLLKLFAGLNQEQQVTLLEFAEFLRSRTPDSPAESLPAPMVVPRPEKESVVAAIKRLTQSYPMVNKGKMLHEVSALMAQHVMQGREANEVIDELEVTFVRHYEKLKGDGDESV